MPGPSQPWDQSADPRESTVDVARPVVAHPAAAGRTPKGSLAELRSRLARLPDGHPSSPYDDAGQIRPLPIRLKQLELGVPAPEREPASSVLPDAGTASAEPVIGEFQAPDAPEQELSRPQLPEPDSSLQDGTLQDGAQPERSVADSAQPDSTLPDSTLPDSTLPDTAEAGGTEPDEAAVDDPTPAGAPSADQRPTGRDVEAAGLTPVGAAPDTEPGPTPGFSPSGAANAGQTPFPAASADGHRPRRPEWGNPYASYGNGNGHAPSDSSAEVNLGPWQPGPPRRGSGLEGLSSADGNGHGPANGHASSQHQRASQPRPDRLDPSQRDAARQDTVQQRAIQPGARRPDSGPRDHRTSRHDSGPRHEPDSGLSRGAQTRASRLEPPGHAAPDLRALVERTLVSCRTAEGRTALGSYGSSGLTPAIRRVSAHLPFGGQAPGSEADTLKSPDRLAAKLARLIARNPGRTAAELAATITDVIRYAFVFESDDYVEGTWLVHRRLKSQGFDLEIRRNRWDSPEYKGIFTQWRDPAHQLAFEVQFHTPASWAVVQRTHDAYVQITDPATVPAERARLRARQVAAAAAANAPPNWAEITDFRLEPR
jgi:hypothetical protein